MELRLLRLFPKLVRVPVLMMSSGTPHGLDVSVSRASRPMICLSARPFVVPMADHNPWTFYEILDVAKRCRNL